MRGVRRRVSRKSRFLVLLTLFGWLFLVLVILPRRRRELELAGGEASTGDPEVSPIAEPTPLPQGPMPLAQDARSLRDVPLALASRTDTRPPTDIGQRTTARVVALRDTGTEALEADPDAPASRPSLQSADKEHHGGPRTLEEGEEALPGSSPPSPTSQGPSSSPEGREEALEQGLIGLATPASDMNSSLDRQPAPKVSTPPAVTDEAQLGLRPYLRAIWRFRWLIPVAVCIAILVPLLLVYRPQWPPGLEPRATVSYVTTTRLLVDSPTRPFLRTQSTSLGGTGQQATSGPGRPAGSGLSRSSVTQSLVGSANVFPLLIESDEVRALRRQLLGNVPGTVRATAFTAAQSATRFRPGVLPVMHITAVAPDPTSALALGPATAQAFKIWLAREQSRAQVLAAERIVVRPLRQPTIATPAGGPAYGLPILAGLALIGAFAGMAVAIDRAFPRMRAGEPSLRYVETAQDVQGESVAATAAHAPAHSSPYDRGLSRTA